METREIFKYSLDVVGKQVIQMPKGAEILTVQMQAGRPQIWAVVEPDNAPSPFEILMVGTGHEMPQEFGRYIGTIQMLDGNLVWHYFEAA